MHTKCHQLTERRPSSHHQQSNVVVVVMVVVVVVVHGNDTVVVVESSCSCSCQNVVAVAMETTISSVEQGQLHQLSFFEFVFILRLQQQRRRHCVLLRPVYSDTTQLNSTPLDVEFSCVAINGPLHALTIIISCRYKRLHHRSNASTAKSVCQSIALQHRFRVQLPVWLSSSTLVSSNVVTLHQAQTGKPPWRRTSHPGQLSLSHPSVG